MAAVGTLWLYRPDPAEADKLQRCGRATFAVRHPSPTRVAVAVLGDVDAVNARDLGRYVERHTQISKQLVVDLRAVDFFGSQAFTALYYISVRCARNDVDWMIIGSPPVRRLLSICDPEGELPLVDDLPSALERLDRLAQRCYHVAPAD
jgi:anti-anti-sigma factor